MKNVRRRALWVVLVSAVIVIVTVLLQAFSIVAYVRGAGQAALDLHGANSLAVHLGQLGIIVGAIWAWWGNWRAIGLAVVFLILSAAQLLMIGDTDKAGGWEHGLHGLLALIVLLAAAAYAQVAARRLEIGRRDSPIHSSADGTLKRHDVAPSERQLLNE